jgi:sugar phosphate isomerase/epimerase
MLWLTVQGKGTDDEAVRVIREIADAADKHGVKVALYPHHGFYVATARDAVRIIEKLDRTNVGATINLCHELRAGNRLELDDIVREAAPHLYFASINGADHEGGWDKLIQVLGEGQFNVSGFLKQLKAVGYSGPIGLQCYNVKGDQRENLKSSMAAWMLLTSH